MQPDAMIEISRLAVHTAFLLAAPVLVVAALTGVLLGVVQAVTQIHDQTVLFVARIIAVVIVLSLCMPWLIQHYTEFTRSVIQQIPQSLVASQPMS